jgi:HEAT repeat protein
VEAFVAAQQQQDFAALRKTEQTILEIGRPAVPELIRLFDHPDPGVQTRAVYLLKELGPLAIPDLRGALSSQDTEVLQNVIWSLELIGSKAVIPDLRGLLDRGDLRLGIRAAKALAALGDNRGFAFLVEQLDAADPDIRGLAVLRLSELEEPRVLIPLIEKLDDKDPYVRMSAIDGLERLGDRRALPVLDGLRREDRSWQIRRSAAAAMQKISGTPVPYRDQLGREVLP